MKARVLYKGNRQIIVNEGSPKEKILLDEGWKDKIQKGKAPDNTPKDPPQGDKAPDNPDGDAPQDDKPDGNAGADAKTAGKNDKPHEADKL